MFSAIISILVSFQANTHPIARCKHTDTNDEGSNCGVNEGLTAGELTALGVVAGAPSARLGCCINLKFEKKGATLNKASNIYSYNQITHVTRQDVHSLILGKKQRKKPASRG